jgi:hypothetical protein
MPGYLDQYGAGHEERARIVRRVVYGGLAILIAGGLLYFFFKNYRQEQQVKRFFELLGGKDYRSAYALWGCTDAKPCPDYPFENFLKDWGPEGWGQQSNAPRITGSRSCGSGVILTVVGEGDRQEKLWVEKQDLVITFSPWPGCPPG